MCPSYRVTRDERDVTRGRANTLRLAITGQLGPDALTSDEMAETMKLCVSCKACRRECPTGVDMARMKIEVQAARAAKYGLSLHDRLVGYLPRYAPYAAKVPWLLNLRDALPGAAKLSEAIAGFSARRTLPQWRTRCVPTTTAAASGERHAKSCCSPTPSTAISSARISMPRSRCSAPAAIACISPSRWTARRGRCAAAAPFSPSARSTKRAAKPSARSPRSTPFVARGVPVVGLEPSCLLELPRRGAGDGEGRSGASSVAEHALTFEEFLAREAQAGRLNLPLKPIADRALVHGHCHQKAFDVFSAGRRPCCRLVPDLKVETDRIELLRHGRRVRL